MIGTSISAVMEKRRHRNTNGSALCILYLAATKPVLHRDTNSSGAIRINSAWLGIRAWPSAGAYAGQELISISSTSKINVS